MIGFSVGKKNHQISRYEIIAWNYFFFPFMIWDFESVLGPRHRHFFFLF